MVGGGIGRFLFTQEDYGKLLNTPVGMCVYSYRNGKNEGVEGGEGGEHALLSSYHESGKTGTSKRGVRI